MRFPSDGDALGITPARWFPSNDSRSVDQNHLTGVISPIAAQRRWEFRADVPKVVAIIAVLVAIAIPMFTQQLERAREATDLANIRSAYAEAMVEAIEDGKAGAYTAETGKAQSTGTFEYADINVDWTSDLTSLSVTSGKPFTVTVTIAADGTATTTVTQASA